jgi:hypothetical protein
MHVVVAVTRIIPHAYGNHQPPLIATEEQLREKTDMLEALLDMEIAASLLKDGAAPPSPSACACAVMCRACAVARVARSVGLTDHRAGSGGETLDPIEQNYRKLKTNMVPVDTDDVFPPSFSFLCLRSI